MELRTLIKGQLLLMETVRERIRLAQTYPTSQVAVHHPGFKQRLTLLETQGLLNVVFTKTFLLRYTLDNHQRHLRQQE